MGKSPLPGKVLLGRALESKSISCAVAIGNHCDSGWVGGLPESRHRQAECGDSLDVGTLQAINGNCMPIVEKLLNNLSIYSW